MEKREGEWGEWDTRQVRVTDKMIYGEDSIAVSEFLKIYFQSSFVFLLFKFLALSWIRINIDVGSWILLQFKRWQVSRSGRRGYGSGSYIFIWKTSGFTTMWRIETSKIKNKDKMSIEENQLANRERNRQYRQINNQNSLKISDK